MVVLFFLTFVRSPQHSSVTPDDRHTQSDFCGYRHPRHLSSSVSRPGICVFLLVALLTKREIFPGCTNTFQIEFGERWPVYGFERHKGYGTSAHRDAIREHGMVEIHRRSFLKNMEASGGKLSENKG